MDAFWARYGNDVLWISGLFLFGRVGIRFLAHRIVAAADDGDASRDSGKEKRSRTLANILMSAGRTLVWAVVLLMLLKVFGVDTTPILAASGVLAFGIGFGMQTVVKDFVAGIIIFVENQFAEGDEVRIGAFEGTVEKMTMRSTVLRDAEGNLVFIANGTVNNVVNRSLKGVRLNGFAADPVKGRTETPPRSA